MRLRSRPVLRTSRQWTRQASSLPPGQPRSRGFGKKVGLVSVFGAAAAATYYYPQLKAYFTDEPHSVEPQKVEVQFEKPRRQADSKEDNRDLISSQHIQVKSSWEHPGVYVWGSNTGKVVDPGSNDKFVKLPRRLAYFDDQLLRDLKLTQGFGAAVTEKGDLVQWGLGFCKADPTPVVTLRGRDITKVQVSADRIIALARNGSVYSVPASRDDQQGGSKQEQQGSSWSLWNTSGKERISFRELTPPSLAYGERISDVSSGLEHCLMLTSKGRVFSAASSLSDYPSKGQMGIPGLNWDTRPSGPFDQPHEIATLRGFDIGQIATGDYHSVVLDKAGRVFAFGDNTYSQLGFPSETKMPWVDMPAVVSLNKLYAGSQLMPKVASIFAGGFNSFFAVDAGSSQDNVNLRSLAPSRRMPREQHDVWAAGNGMLGTLGTGRWTHVSGDPNKVPGLSSLFEFDETTNKMIPIKLRALSVGTTHCSAVLDNVTETSISRRAGANETNWGADVVFWGGNEFYQLGTGKRSNMNAPTYIGPLDGGRADAQKGRKGESHRLCVTPRQTARLGEGGKGRKVTLEQKVECGRFVTGVYSSV